MIMIMMMTQIIIRLLRDEDPEGDRGLRRQLRELVLAEPAGADAHLQRHRAARPPGLGGGVHLGVQRAEVAAHELDEAPLGRREGDVERRLAVLVQPHRGPPLHEEVDDALRATTPRRAKDSLGCSAVRSDGPSLLRVLDLPESSLTGAPSESSLAPERPSARTAAWSASSWSAPPLVRHEPTFRGDRPYLGEGFSCMAGLPIIFCAF